VTKPGMISSNRRAHVEPLQTRLTHQVGILKTTLLLAVAVTASNLRQLLTWSHATVDVTDPLTPMEVGPASFEETDPATDGVGNTGPPAAA
jgi:hypothetical protein